MRLWVLGVFAVLSVGACSSSTTNEAGSGGTDGGAATGGSAGTASGGSNTGGSGPNDAGTDGDAGLACPAGMVALSAGFCIDATEVTNEAYAKWLATTSGTPSLDPPCDWVQDLAPAQSGACGNRNTNPSGPVSCVDWCEAYTFCRNQKKHLCGQRKGGAVEWSSHDDPDVDEWHYACTNGGKNAYPYGDSYTKDTCADSSPGFPVNTKLKTECRGTGQPFAQVFDMSGNVAEWVNSCVEELADPEDRCLVRGGSTGLASPTPEAFSCAGPPGPDGGESGELARRDSVSPHVGFRCCWDPSTDK